MKRKKIKKKFVLFLPIIWLLLVFGLSTIPNIGNTPLGQPVIFKIIGHVLGYAVFTFFLIAVIEIYLPRTKESNSLETLLLTAAIVSIAFIIAVFNEYLQIFIPGRGGCLRDVGFDGIGILITVAAWRILKKVRRRRK